MNENPIPPPIPPSTRKPSARRTSREDFAVYLILIVVVGLLAAIAVPSFNHARIRGKAGIAQYHRVDAAKDQYMLENSKDKSVTPTWADLTPYLKVGNKLWWNDGKDSFGNPIILGTLGERVRVHPDTKKACEGVVDDAYWGPFS